MIAEWEYFFCYCSFCLAEWEHLALLRREKLARHARDGRQKALQLPLLGEGAVDLGQRSYVYIYIYTYVA